MPIEQLLLSTYCYVECEYSQMRTSLALWMPMWGRRQGPAVAVGWVVSGRLTHLLQLARNRARLIPAQAG